MKASINRIIEKVFFYQPKFLVYPFIILFFITVPYSFAGENSGIGYHGASFLRISPAARQVAMGEAFSALADDVNLLRYNVAGLGNLRHIMLAANFHDWLDDTQQGSVGLALPTKYGVFGADFSYFNEGEIVKLDEFFQQTGGTLSSDNFLVTLGYGSYVRLFNYNFTFGASFKFLRQNLVGETNSTYGFDLGSQLRLKHFSFAATIQNLGLNKIKFDETSSSLPLTYRIGSAFRYRLDDALVLNLAADAGWTTSENLRYYTGGELILSDLIAFRAGYKLHKVDPARLSLGFGLNIPMAWLAESQTRLDYAYTDMSDFETTAHRFSLLFTFGVAQQVRPFGETPGYSDRLRRELDAAEKARLAAEQAEARYEKLGREIARRLAYIKSIAAESQGKIEVEPQTDQRILVSLRINFDFDKSDVRPDDFKTMSQVGEILNTYPEAEVHISGHTDSIGPDEYNIRLSQRRIESVIAYLAKNESVYENRFFMPVGYGELRPIEPNDTPEGRFRNRRVEFLLFTFDSKPEIPDGSAIQNVEVVDQNTVQIVCNGKVEYTMKEMNDPERLIFDFQNIFLLSDVKTIKLNAGPFKQARLGYHPAQKFSRVVFDLDRKVRPNVVIKDNVVIISTQ